MHPPRLAAAAIALCAASACGPPRKPHHAAVVPLYDQSTGRLVRLTHDANMNGRQDTWTDMSGAVPLRSRIDRNEDGRIDRWEYYDAAGRILKVGFSRRDDGTPDAWAYARADGSLERIEISSTADESRIDRREFFTAATPEAEPVLVRVEEDVDRNGAIDKWEEFDAGELRAAAWDTDGDGRPDRRVTWRGGVVAAIESDPDASGAFTRRVEPR